MRDFARILVVTLVPVAALVFAPPFCISANAQGYGPSVANVVQGSFSAVRTEAPHFFGATLVRTDSGDPAVRFSGKENSTETASIGLFQGQPAFLFPAVRFHNGIIGSSSTGFFIVGRDFFAFVVEGGNKAHPEDAFALRRSDGTFIAKAKHSYAHLYYGKAKWVIIATLHGGKRNLDVQLTDGFGTVDNRAHAGPASYYSSSTALADFINRLASDFDATLTAFKEASGLTDLDQQLSANAHYRVKTEAELAAAVARERNSIKQADREAEQNHGGGGFDVLAAILTGAAQGVAGQGSAGSDSAILQAGAQQAAAIRAIGDQNAAAQQQAAQARIAAEQARAARAAQEKERERLAAEQKQREIAAAQQRAIAAAGNSTSTAGGQQVASGNSNVGSKPVTCTSMNNLVSVRSKWGKSCEHEVVLWLINNSTESADCVWAFHRNGKFGDAGMTTIPSGQTRGGEGGGMWTCGADTDQVEYACFPHKQNEDQTFACTSRVKW